MNTKEIQIRMLLELNPMTEKYGINSIEDIKTFEEAIQCGDDFFCYGDYYKNEALQDLKRKKVRIYSDKEIKDGTYITTSLNKAIKETGCKREDIKSKVVAIDEVAFINGSEGFYANAKKYKYIYG